MVAARTIEPQREHITVELVHEFRGDYPDVPTLPDVNIEELTKPDIEAGLKPFYVTLALAAYNQQSRNNRTYSGDVAIRAIYDAIANQKIGGNKGHTPEHLRSTYFEAPVLHWIGVKIVGEGERQTLWAKAYVPGDSERMREMRGYYQRQMATNSCVGTSLEGWGYQEYDEENDTYIITDLTVYRIDAVEGLQTGIPMAGMRPPKITSETNNPIREAEQGEIAEGDFVTWDRDGAMVVGQVNTVFTEGEVQIPYNDDAPVLTATEENQIARMWVFEANWEDGGWKRTNWQVVQYVKDLTKITMLPESAQGNEPALSEGQADNETSSDSSTTTGEISMGEKKEQPTAEERIAELQTSHQTQLTELQAQLQEAQTKARNAEATLINLRKAIGVAEGADAIETAQSLVSERDGLKTENAALLETAIERAVEEKAKIVGEALQSESEDVKAFAETVRTMIRTQVQAESISKKAEIEPKVLNVIEAANIQSMLKALRTAAMGPNITNPLGEANNGKATNPAVLIPGEIN